MQRLRPVPLVTRPRVSVVIPCYNYGRYLPEAVSSALNQSGVDVDVLIVDDCSTDDSAAVAQRLAAADSRVDVLLHEENRGHIQTYNDGLAKARGDYVTLVSADDLVARDALTRAVALMEAHPSVGLVYGWAQSFRGAPLPGEKPVRNWTVWSGGEWLSLAARRGRCFLSSPEAVMRREALEQADGYDARLPHSADFAMWMRTALRWDIGRVNGPVQAHYRVHQGNMHLTTYAGWHRDLEERRRTFDLLFEEQASDDAALARLRPLAMRALAREALRRGLRAQRDSGDRATGAAALRTFRDFAVATDASVHATPLGMLSTMRSRYGDVALGRRVRRTATRVIEHLEWRRRRRWGS